MRRQPHVSGQAPILLSAYPHSKVTAKEATGPRLFNRPDAGGCFLRIGQETSAPTWSTGSVGPGVIHHAVGELSEARMGHTLEDAERIARSLRALPAIDSSKRTLTKQAMIKRLAREIASLQQRGYSIEQVADSLRGNGLDISTPTLKSYLHRSKRKQGQHSARKPARTETPKVPVKPAASLAAPAVAETRPDGAALRNGKNAFLVNDKESY